MCVGFFFYVRGLTLNSEHSQGTGKWYELQDLQVTDILPQMITLSEAYIQVSVAKHLSETLPADGK